MTVVVLACLRLPGKGRLLGAERKIAMNARDWRSNRTG